MASKDLSDQLKDLTLKAVIPQNKELGRGAYGKVFTVNHLGLHCAAKEIHSLLLDGVSPEDKKAIKDGFIRECYHSSLIRHPNIVQFMGIYYTERSDLPIMVMESMDTNLTSFIEKNQSKIAVETKLSILHDVSLGLSYLHGRRPAVIHRDLSSNNVLLSRKGRFLAKISDLGTAKMIRADSKQTRSRLTTAPGTLHFMPPEVLDEENPIYGTPVDVFSFAGVALHLFSEKWPTPSGYNKRDPITKKMVSLSEVERRQQYLDTMTVEGPALKYMLGRCLDDDPDERPSIQEVSPMIKSVKETPPLAEALQSGYYHIKWTTCSDLPTPMYDAYVAVSNETIYCTGTTPDEDNEHEVYSYNTRTDQWKQLPRPGHRLGVIHMVDDKLTIFGGRDSTTDEFHNKVTTYNNIKNSWYSHFPNMLYNRSKPGVMTSHYYVIVMGGGSSPDTHVDNMEVMNYHHLQWREVSVHLPISMSAIKPTISGDNIIIVGYTTAASRNNGCYQIQTEELILSFDQSLSPGVVPLQWKKLSAATHFYTSTVPYSNLPVTVGGSIGGVCTSDVSLYGIHKNLWRKVGSLTSVRNAIGVALLNNHTVIVIGGTTGGVGVKGAKASSLSIVEIGTIVPNQ